MVSAKSKIGELIIEVDNDSIYNPRQWDNLGKMLCFHSRYNLGDANTKYRTEDYNSWEEMERDILKKEDVAVILPLYLYDHSGITMNTTGFNRIDSYGWDWGRIGFIFTTKDNVRNCYNVKRITKNLLERVKEHLLSEVNEYDDYISGNVYRFDIYDGNGEYVDGCGGFFGSDWDNNGMKDQIPFEYLDLVDKLEWR